MNSISDIDQQKSIKNLTSINIYDFRIEIDNDFLSITINSYPLLSILFIDKLFILWLRFRSISINRY